MSETELRPVTHEQTINQDDVNTFAELSGDANPMHIDEDYAENTRFGERIAHGALVASLISAALAKLPGQVIYLNQESNFMSPVMPPARLRARAEVESRDGKTVNLSTEVRDVTADETVIEGTATVIIDESDPCHHQDTSQTT